MNKTKSMMFKLLSAVAIVVASSLSSLAHDGPDPIIHWQFKTSNIKQNLVQARLGPDATFSHPPTFVNDSLGQSARFNGRGMQCVVAEDFKSVEKALPTKEMTVSAWVAIDQPIEYGSIVGTFQDNGDEETGWLLGYRNSSFCFALASQGADDGNGKMTYLTGKSKFEPGKMYHIAAVFDGKKMELYVNGKLDGDSQHQSGEILYPSQAPFVIGAYRDDNEFEPMTGRIREVSIYNLAAKPKWVAEEFEHLEGLASLPATIVDGGQEFVVKPYLQYGTQTGMTVMWRAAKSGHGKVHWGEDSNCVKVAGTSEESEINSIRIENLKPETQYFYWVESINAAGQPIESEVSTFQTACLPKTPFAFAIPKETLVFPDRLQSKLGRGAQIFCCTRVTSLTKENVASNGSTSSFRR